MRISTLVLASAFVWGVAPGSAIADSNESDLAAPQALEQVVDEATAPGVVADPQDAPADPAPGSAETQAPADTPAPPAAFGGGTVQDPGPSPDLSWDDFEDPGFDPIAPKLVEPEPDVQVVSSSPEVISPPSPRSSSSRSSSIPLGPMGVDENGVEGRIHTVSTGETLWDISEAYLGTPWVWPSVWDENQKISNPHLIEPLDKIWITSSEMRRLTDEEADRMLAALPLEDDFVDEEVFAEEPLPAAVEDEPELPVAAFEPESNMTGEIITLPRQHDANFAGVDDMENAGQIVDAPAIRAFLTQGDEVYLDLGDGEVAPGDKFSIFRDVDKIRDLETGAVIGYHFDQLGWLEVMKIEGESSIAVIQGARGEIERGDHMLPRVSTEREVAVLTALDDIDGAIVFTPGYRWMMGMTDSVYLNVGAIHGVEVGTEMEVYIPGQVQKGSKMPDTVVAKLVVISVDPETSVGFVTETERELEIGDQVRATIPERLAAR